MSNSEKDTFNRDNLRYFMLKEKNFLSSLYSTNVLFCTRALGSGTETQLKTLIKIIYCISNGIIPGK